MLHARPPVMDEIFVDLTAALSLRRFIDGKFDSTRAVLHHLAHQGRVVRTDILIVEEGELAKAHYVAVKGDPFIHFAEFYVADDMLDRCDSCIGSGLRLLYLLKTRQVTALLSPLS